MNKSKKPKIAIFHCGFIYTGGGERIVLEEMQGLRSRGYQVDCFVPTYDSELSYPDIIEDYGIQTFLPQLPRKFPLRFAAQIVASCLLAPVFTPKFSKYDIFLGANQPGAYLAWVVANLLKKPYFVYLSQPNRVLYPRDHENWHNVPDYYFLNKVINNVFKKPVAHLDKRSINGGKELFINGSFVAKEINRVYNPTSWADCPGGAHTPDESTIRAGRMKGKVKVDGHSIKKPYILYTSRHEPWKKFDWAVKSVSKVIKKHSDVRFVIPGAETTVTPKLKKLAKKLGIKKNVIFTGPIDDKSLWRLYQNAAIYIFTSPKEDLGIVVQEAQAAGLPVVAWKAGGPTVTVEDGVTGYLAKPYELDELAEKTVFLLKNPEERDKMGMAAWKHTRDNFSWERHVDALEKAFLQAI